MYPDPISIRIDILWVQLLLDFSTDHLETMHTFSTWSKDVHVVLDLSCHYLFSTCCFFFQLSFFFSCDRMIWVACGRNSSYSFLTKFLQICRCFVMVRRCVCAFGVILPSFVIKFAGVLSWSEDVYVLLGLSSRHLLSTFFNFFDALLGPVNIRIDTLWVQLILQFSTYNFNYAYLFYMVCGLGVILRLYFINLFHFFDLVFQGPFSIGIDILLAQFRLELL